MAADENQTIRLKPEAWAALQAQLRTIPRAERRALRKLKRARGKH